MHSQDKKETSVELSQDKCKFHVKQKNKKQQYNYLIMNNKLLLDNLRSIPDWPIKGVNFRDVTTLFKNAECLKNNCR